MINIFINFITVLVILIVGYLDYLFYGSFYHALLVIGLFLIAYIGYFVGIKLNLIIKIFTKWLGMP
jgi:hypothetical protein